MFKGSKASQYAHELHSARLKGPSASKDAHGDFHELVRKLVKASPSYAGTCSFD